MRRLFIFLLTTLWLMPCAAQTEGEQVLIYRNTGVINLLFNNETDSITLSKIDAEGMEHDEFVTQVFHTTDTILSIPIEEIDSVAFGNRNAIELKPNVKIMTVEDSTYIIRYDGMRIYYKTATPESILPKPGDKLFYGKMDNLFPIGLIAKVTNVSQQGSETVVTVEDVELSELFEQLFYAGRINTPAPRKAPGKRAPIDISRTLNCNMDFGEDGNVEAEDKFSIHGNIVACPLKGFYSLNADISNELLFNIKGKTDKEKTVEKDLIKIPLGVYALVFTPEIAFKGFVTVTGELSTNLGVKRDAAVHLNYVKERGKDAVMKITDPQGADNGTSYNIDMTLDGEIYTGFQCTLDFNILRETVGARLNLRIGSSIEGEFGLGVLAKTDSYMPEVYSKAELTTSIKVQEIGTLYIRNLLFGEEDERQLFVYDIKLNEQQRNLFPQFTQTRGVNVSTKHRKAISLATKTDTPIIRPLEAGFELIKADGTVIDSVFVNVLKENDNAVQGLATEIDITNKGLNSDEKLIMRPVFHYAGHTVRAQNSDIMGGMQIQPMVFGLSNGAVTYLSGIPFNGMAKDETTLYTAGPYIPIAVKDSVFNNKKPIITGVFIDENKEKQLIGTWTGKEKDETVTYVFEDNGSGKYESATSNRAFSYLSNNPQSGKIRICFDDNGDIIIISVININESIMQYKKGNGSDIYTLNKRF